MTVGTPAVEPFEDAAPGESPIRGFLHRPASAVTGGLVLTHGAGSDCHAPLLLALAVAFAARGVAVLRCDLPYRQARRTGPPRPGDAPRDREGLKRAVELLRRRVPARIFLGGQSYGGRQASMLAAEEPGLAEALLLLSYPLHPPGHATRLRTAHFPRLRTPALFAHGSADPFGSVDELEAARTQIPARTALIVIEGAGHGLGRGGRTPGPAAGAVERIVDGLLAFAQA
jgi:predicted alpha/beta-hydrolase family hydrolase